MPPGSSRPPRRRGSPADSAATTTPEAEHEDRERRVRGVHRLADGQEPLACGPRRPARARPRRRPRTARPRTATGPRTRPASPPPRPAGPGGRRRRARPARARRRGSAQVARGTAAAARRTRRRARPRAPAPSPRAKPPKVRSRWGIASRLVRLETGSSREAEFAIRRQAWAPGRDGVPIATAAPIDDRGQQHDGGVEAEHGGDRGGQQEDAGEQPLGAAAAGVATTRCAAAVNRPARAQTSATTRIVARKATTGPRCRSASSASARSSRPVASAAAAAARPSSASVRPRGVAVRRGRAATRSAHHRAPRSTRGGTRRNLRHL